MKALVKKTPFGYAYKTDGNSNFKYFGSDIASAEDIQNYFQTGRHTTHGGRFDPVKLEFINDSGQPYVSYLVRKAGSYTEAVVNLDGSKKLLISDNDLWPAADRLKYLSENTIRELPADLDKALDIIADDTELLTRYREESKERTSDEAIRSFLNDHAKQYHKLPAVIEFK